MRSIFERFKRRHGTTIPDNISTMPNPEKYREEIAFRRSILGEYLRWFDGELAELYGVPAPRPEQKVPSPVKVHRAILTYLELVQKPKYLADLKLDAGALAGMTVLDVGSGPMPSALVFRDIDLYCLDPLLPAYLQVGFPIHLYERVRFVHSFSEAIPLPDRFFDAVISVNAIDHVDDFDKTTEEIRRVLKPGGRIQMHVHYHRRTPTEPIELNDAIMASRFSWCRGFRKLGESTTKFGSEAQPGEAFAVWGNPDTSP